MAEITTSNFVNNKSDGEISSEEDDVDLIDKNKIEKKMDYENDVKKKRKGRKMIREV